MTFSGRSRLALLFGLTMVSFGASRAWADRPSIDDLKWLASDADPVAELTSVPAECARSSEDPDVAYAVRLGRVAFRSPALLGGLAARVGLRCDSCHRNGHGNPSFHVRGVSGSPGTADVTGSVFSRTRDDHVFNPVPIPSLMDVATHSRFGSVRPAKDLSSFIRVAIVEEFDGLPPSRSILEALVAYVASLRSKSCPDPAAIAVTFETAARELRETLAVAIESLDRHDISATRLVLRSYRALLGRIHQRFPEVVSEREGLVELSRSLSGAGWKGPEEPDTAALRALLVSIREKQAFLLPRLGERADESLFNPSRLREALGSGGGA